MKKIRMSLTAIDGEIVYSNESVTGYYVIPTMPFQFVDDEEKQVLAQRINNALAALVTSGTQATEGVLHVIHRPVNSEEWAREWEENVRHWGNLPGLSNYIQDSKRILDSAEFTNKHIYIGVTLGKRGSFSRTKNQGVLEDLKSTIFKSVDALSFQEDYEVSEKELRYWRRKNQDIKRIITQGPLKAVPATPEEIALLFKKTLNSVTPVGIQEKEYWGQGEVSTLAESHISNYRKYLKVTQMDEKGQESVTYKATLCFAKFPETIQFPEEYPWMHYSSLLSSPADMYSRFTLEPAAKVRKQLGQKLQEIQDEASNAQGEGNRSIPLGIQERFESATGLEHELSKTPEPWFYGWHRLAVEGGTLDELKDRVQEVIDHYRNLNIKLVWPSGDQLKLLLESQPGDKVRQKSYFQRQSLSIIGGGMPTANSSVGDRVILKDGKKKGWRGAYIGYTSQDTVEPVFFSPHLAPALNAPPGIVITGSPGGGKSFLSFTLTAQLVLQGVWTIYIDPKADATNMKEIRELGNVETIDLRRGYDGILDPWNLKGLELSEKKLLALGVLELLLKDVSNSETSIISSVLDEMESIPDPSLNKLVDILGYMKQDEVAISLYRRLNLIRTLPFARLCFSDMTVAQPIDPRAGLTIVTMLGLPLPGEEVKKDDYTQENRLAIAIMHLLTTLTRQLMVNADENPLQPHPKAVVIDEAWAVMSTPSGEKVISELLRLGRSLYTTTILISQNSVDFLNKGLMNSVSTQFAFRAKSKEDILSVCASFGLEYSNAYERMIKSLENGECLMKDLDDRISRVQIHSWNKDWFNAFNTNPESKSLA